MPKPQLYDDNPSKDLILQGDIFTEIDFFLTDFESKTSKGRGESELTEIVLPPSGTGSVISLIGETAPDVETDKSVTKEPVLKQYSEKRLVAIVSQTCDIADGEYVVVSPIYTLEEYERKLETNGEKAEKIKEHRKLIINRKGLLDKFYLENLQVNRNTQENCFIDLRQMNTVNKNIFSPRKRLVSLSHWGRQVLNYQLMWVYGRPVIEW